MPNMIEMGHNTEELDHVTAIETLSLTRHTVAQSTNNFWKTISSI